MGVGMIGLRIDNDTADAGVPVFAIRTDRSPVLAHGGSGDTEGTQFFCSAPAAVSGSFCVPGGSGFFVRIENTLMKHEVAHALIGFRVTLLCGLVAGLKTAVFPENIMSAFSRDGTGEGEDGGKHEETGDTAITIHVLPHFVTVVKEVSL